jgi:hypothetical protein
MIDPYFTSSYKRPRIAKYDEAQKEYDKLMAMPKEEREKLVIDWNILIGKGGTIPWAQYQALKWYRFRYQVWKKEGITKYRRVLATTPVMVCHGYSTI